MPLQLRRVQRVLFRQSTCDAWALLQPGIIGSTDGHFLKSTGVAMFQFKTVKRYAFATLKRSSRALAIYFPARGRPLGCFAIGTALTEAAEDAEIRSVLLMGVSALDDYFEARIRAAQKGGEISKKADAATLAILASATLHTIAIRARAGAERAELEKLARNAVAVICTAQ